ncbi:hypothetical protein TRIATDRAFT_275539 [Trichoderma atroviride IMI 206040]|uniref:Uncharacterized protein n=1 Tax=Hypocrea atroviridis (strain ATCC 20476 / IMI 206040) TaxID=452589 RepID=G9NXS6_HYPAI|nr:uncharacterized protein TRIATDRAFT_275539 [Trichoderma atroviride IMI 206040]EHK44256.1 hypothetical protein TRIATDRAFT_275539 [Trichoderma atroviride IMI 206040]
MTREYVLGQRLRIVNVSELPSYFGNLFLRLLVYREVFKGKYPQGFRLLELFVLDPITFTTTAFGYPGQYTSTVLCRSRYYYPGNSLSDRRTIEGKYRRMLPYAAIRCLSYECDQTPKKAAHAAYYPDVCSFSRTPLTQEQQGHKGEEPKSRELMGRTILLTAPSFSKSALSRSSITDPTSMVTGVRSHRMHSVKELYEIRGHMSYGFDDGGAAQLPPRVQAYVVNWGLDDLGKYMGNRKEIPPILNFVKSGCLTIVS